MSASVQHKSLRRKLIYSALIVALLTMTLVVRKADFALGSVTVRGIVPQARALELREEDMGEADLLGSAMMLTLTGSRGLVVCGLWWDATDLQAKNEWNQLELRIRLITKLQPHFITPWRYQSWNLAYNVSVEPDNNVDKYFYISLGLMLLAEGERRNSNNPDMRYDLGFYMQDKFGTADESKTFRSLFELSCTDPVERNPIRFRPDVARPDQIAWPEFEKFCAAHPFLIRRLREGLGKSRPSDVIRFLEQAQKIPSLFEDRSAEDSTTATRLKPVQEQFPPMPKLPNFDTREEIHEGRGELPYYLCNNFDFARAWYEYAQDPMYLEQPRMPRHRLSLFRSYPARAQAFIGERLEQEGWYDEVGWKISDWFPVNSASPLAGKRTVTLGGEQDRIWAQEAWDKAYRMYVLLGQDTITPTQTFIGLQKSEEQLKALDPEARLHYGEDRGIVNYSHWLGTCEAERTTEALKARRKFAEAKKYMRLRLNAKALETFEDPAAFGPPNTWERSHCTGWKKLFLDPAHREFREDEDVQEEIYRLQELYLKVFKAVRQEPINKAKVRLEMMAQAATPFCTGIPWSPVAEFGSEKPLALTGPFDDVDYKGVPLISAGARPQPSAAPKDPEVIKKLMQDQQKQMQERMKKMQERMPPPSE